MSGEPPEGVRDSWGATTSCYIWPFALSARLITFQEGERELLAWLDGRVTRMAHDEPRWKAQGTGAGSGRHLDFFFLALASRTC